MQSRIETLLTLREGQLLDARLQALPDAAPPADAWERIARELDRDATRRFGRPLRWAASATIAAAVAVTAVLLITRQPEVRRSAPPATTVADGVRQAPFAGAVMSASYVALVEESARLERVLAELPTQRPLMTAGTASTIVGLEDRIAFIDEQLTLAAAGKAELPQREALWGERVELMYALVYVRFGQAQPSGF